MNSEEQSKTPLHVHLAVFGAPLFFLGCGLLLNWIDPENKNLFLAQMAIYTSVFAILYGITLAVRRLLTRRDDDGDGFPDKRMNVPGTLGNREKDRETTTEVIQYTFKRFTPEGGTISENEQSSSAPVILVSPPPVE